jgi:hypothetical protein
VVVLMPAVHAPQPNVVGEGVVVLVGNAEVLLTFRALAADVPVIVEGDGHLEMHVTVGVVSEELDAIGKPEVVHRTSMHGGWDTHGTGSRVGSAHQSRGYPRDVISRCCRAARRQ